MGEGLAHYESTFIEPDARCTVYSAGESTLSAFYQNTQWVLCG